jgi:RNA polymerase sigma-70 factor, ECF subfamily
MEAVWIAAARTGDERAAAALFERYAPRLRRSVACWTPDADTADDVCQEAWLRAFRALPGFRGDANFGTWLHTIARNLAIGRGRSTTRHDQVLASHDPPTSERAQPIELRIDLQRAIAALPPGMRHILWLHDVEGWKHAEIAVSLGIAEGTSKSQLFKARAQVRRHFTNGSATEQGNGRPTEPHRD